jgi:glutaredoxin
MNEINLSLCPYCRKIATYFDIIAGKSLYHYQCDCCGEFKIPYIEILILNQENDEYREQYYDTRCNMFK